MSFWINNKLTIKGNSTAIQKMLTEIAGEPDKDGNPRHIDFNKIVPMPQILENTSYGGHGPSCYADGSISDAYGSISHANGCILKESADGREKWMASKRPFTKEEAHELEKIGCYNWSDWSSDHWGTICNAEFTLLESTKRNSVCISFMTHWGPPTLILRVLRKKYPDLKFVLKYKNDGNKTFRICKPVETVTTKINNIYKTHGKGKLVPAIINYTGSDAPAFIRQYYKEAEDEIRQMLNECFLSSPKYYKATQEEKESIEKDCIELTNGMIDAFQGMRDDSIERVMASKSSKEI